MHRWLQPASSASGRETPALLSVPRSRSHANVSEGAIKSTLPSLSSHEEIALRRIAHGSNVDQPTAARLQDLVLIQLTNRGYRLTPLGRLRYDSLPKAPLLGRPRSIRAVMGYVEGLIDKARSRT